MPSGVSAWGCSRPPVTRNEKLPEPTPDRSAGTVSAAGRLTWGGGEAGVSRDAE